MLVYAPYGEKGTRHHLSTTTSSMCACHNGRVSCWLHIAQLQSSPVPMAVHLATMRDGAPLIGSVDQSLIEPCEHDKWTGRALF
eukprot:226094-Prymnesium_polylepis.2